MSIIFHRYNCNFWRLQLWPYAVVLRRAWSTTLAEWTRQIVEAIDRHCAWARSWTVQSSTNPNYSRIRPRPMKKNIKNSRIQYSRGNIIFVGCCVIRTGCKPVNSLASLKGCSGPLSGKLAGNTSPLFTITPNEELQNTRSVNKRLVNKTAEATERTSTVGVD